MAHNPNRDTECPNPPDDGVTSVSWSPVGSFLAASSWDSTVRVYEVAAHATHDTASVQGVTPKLLVRHAAPVLCTAWSGDGARFFSAGCDNVAKMYTLQSQAHVDVGRHAAPVSAIAYSDQLGLVLTGSWDKTVKLWDGRQQNAVHSIALPERCYSMSLMQSLLVIATASRELVVYDLRNPNQEARRIASMLKYQTRTVACFPDASGFAYGSIEGRVSITYLTPARESETFAFKCHRPTATDVFAVNDIAFCQATGTFATCGADGSYCFWDKDSKTRLNQFERADAPLTCCAFNQSGSLFAYGLGYDWSKGHTGHDPLRAKNRVMVRAVPQKDIKPKDKGKGRR